MKVFSQIFGSQKKKTAVKTISEYQQEMLIRQGREQFKKLVDRGLRVPVALL
jgi:hypothetical protein